MDKTKLNVGLLKSRTDSHETLLSFTYERWSLFLCAIVQGTHDEFNVDFKRNRQTTHIACALV